MNLKMIANQDQNFAVIISFVLISSGVKATLKILSEISMKSSPKKKVEIVSGPDEVCAKCPYLKDEKCASHEYTDETILVQDKKALGLLGFVPGEIVDWKMIAAIVPDILEEWKAQFCEGCGYREVCFNK
ncbi:MAG: hypothetical protein MPEBLZ_00576 [Candidatus Methanoperedens nitroreducens]|uniref:DUF1284 domain-containing protein n=1 Tax=Candidatus Methanoperedens nitratireducens TaxID=1392998 RepID=A0A0P8ADC7_9EURY|nr:MAG: hypothetical protein MPEBLZ_00576 [Candidatus Methanoperedens sp. BLZ1]